MSFHIFLSIIIGIILVILILNGLNLIQEYERAVVFRLGRFSGIKGPGLFFIIPWLDNIQIVDLRTQVVDVPRQEAITKDNVPAIVNASVFYSVEDAGKAIIRVEDYNYAVSQISQTTLRSVIGSVDLDDLLSNRDKINDEIMETIDEISDAWGVDVSKVELKDLEVPNNMKRAMAKQAESERERRSRIILADGELQASKKLAKAAEEMAAQGGMSLRLFQTIQEISTENSSTVIIPFPAEFTRVAEAMTKSMTGGNSPMSKSKKSNREVSEAPESTPDLKELLEKDKEEILEETPDDILEKTSDDTKDEEPAK